MIHIYRASGEYCTCRDWQDMYYVSHFKVKCPNCGKTEVIKPNLAQLISLVRHGRGLSKAELARQAGISVSTITALENQNSTGNKSTIEKIVKVLDANHDLFIREWEDARRYKDRRLKDYFWRQFE